ncbi:MAG: hypothetical protein MMC33_003569 [Icmadophila ericetorum]|nr:hypothetical protein [Icmadophila ericetorum]
MSTSRLRPILLSVSVAAIAATGAWYGAGLKWKQEYKQEVSAIRELGPAERIKQLQTMRKQLVAQRDDVQNKILTLDQKIAKAQGKRAQIKLER